LHACVFLLSFEPSGYLKCQLVNPLYTSDPIGFYDFNLGIVITGDESKSAESTSNGAEGLFSGSLVAADLLSPRKKRAHDICDDRVT
jgi:hypothetical protein